MFRDFEELLESLNDARVRYLIGGAHALALHARPRATKDLDLFVEPTTANARRFIAALRAFFGTGPPAYVTVWTTAPMWRRCDPFLVRASGGRRSPSLKMHASAG